MDLQRVFVLVFTFIYNLKFPSGSSIARILLTRYGRPALNKYRRLERLHWTFHKAAEDLTFLNTCKEYGVTPKFLLFRTSLSNLYGSRLYQSMLFKLLAFEIKNKINHVNRLKQEFFNCFNEFKSTVSWLDFKILTSKISHNSESKIKEVKSRHKKKLWDLGIPSSSLNPDNIITNLSSRVLTKSEKEALVFGLDFRLPVSQPKFVNHFMSFEKIINVLSRLPFYNPQSKSVNFKEITDKVCHLAHNSYNNFRKVWCKSFFSKDKLNTLRTLRKDENIIISKPDKGRGVVILDKTVYIDKVLSILSDSSKFLKLQVDPLPYIIKLEDKLNRLLRSLKDKVITTEVYNNLFASGSVPGILYGLPKIHKPSCPIRPILSAIGTVNYNLAKFFVPLLGPLTTNEFTVRNSADFAHEIRNYTFSDPVFMASFDIKSLFTNIPLDETIDICTEMSFSNMDRFFNFTKKQFKSLLDFAVKECIFLFNNEYYKQIDGVAMGSPLGPSLANVFLCHHEINWLNDCPAQFKPLLYRRYVDDCFLLFKEPNHVDEFLQYVNLKHPNIKFTVERENNDKLPFLDILVHKKHSGFTTSVYRKNTFTNLGQNFMSFVPRIFKLNSISTLLYRCFKLSSNWQLFQSEIDFLKSYFLTNGYPISLFENILRKFLDNVLISKSSNCTVPKQKIYFSLPYYGYNSFQIRRDLSKLFNEVYPQISPRFVFVNSFSIGSLFRFKDRIPKTLRSNVVYKFECSCCNAGYIGSSVRNLGIRTSEHKGLSYRTGLPLSKPPFSEIREHSLNLGHNFNLENFEILMNVNDRTSLRIAESLFIHDLKPSLNNYDSSFKIFTH